LFRESVEGLKDVKIFPNPYFLNSDLYVSFYAGKRFKKFEFHIFTIGFRKINEINLQGSYSSGRKVININASKFKNFAKGLYYYIIIIETSDGEKLKSKIDRLIIIN